MSIFTSFKKAAARLFMAVACILAAGTASAETPEFTPIEVGVQYQTPTGLFKDSYYSFVAPMTGTATIHSTSEIPSVFADATLETPVEFTWIGYGGNLSQFAVGDLVEGQTYYIHVRPWDPITFMITMEKSTAKPEIESLTPAENSVFNVTGDGLIGIRFTKNIHYSVAKITCGSTEVEIHGEQQSGIHTFNIKKHLFSWLNNKIIERGDEFLFVMEGVCDANNSEIVYGENGTVTVKYIAPEMPIMKVSEQAPTEFLSYWLPGDPDGIITLTFSGEVAEGATATIGWGNSEIENEFYIETVPTKVDGNTLTVDLTGKLRTPKTMLPESTVTATYKFVNLQINNIKDTKGNYCYAEGQGSLGSFGWSPTYKDITGNIFTEFLPASGSSLKGVKSIELWIDRRDLIAEFEGIAVNYFAADGDSVTGIINKKELTIVEGSDLTITIPVNEEMQKGKNVVVSLSGAIFTDGLERDIKAVYNVIDTGIDTPVAATDVLNGTFDIFTTDGKLIAKDANRKTLERLKPGIYVVGGMKIAIQ